MSQFTEKSLKLAFTLAKEKAEAVLADSHTGADAKASITALLKISESYRDLYSTTTGATSDMRVLRRRAEQMRFENTKLEERLAEFKKQVLKLATEVEMLGVEAGQIMKRNEKSPNSPDRGSAERIMACALRVVDVVTKILQPKAKSE